MEEQEKIDIREHLIGWIDTLLKNGIVPQVVNPKAIRANYIRKSKIKEKIEELEKRKKYLLDANLKDIGTMIGCEDCDEKIELYKELMEDK